MNRSLVVAVALVGLGLSACTTVTSAPDTRFDTQPTGIAYFMPMRLARLTITATPVNLTDMITARDEKVVVRTAARAGAAAATTKREQAQSALNGATDANRTALTRALEAATEEETKAKAAATDANNVVEELTRGIYAVQMSGDTCTYAPVIDLLPVQADRRRRFTLQPQHHELRDDIFKINLTPTGLLTTADITTVDQTGQVIIDLGGALGAAAGIDRTAGEEEGCAGPATWSAVVDPAETSAIDELNRQLFSAHLPFYATTQVDGPALSRTRDADAALPAPRVAEGIFYRSAAPLLFTLFRTPPPPGTPASSRPQTGVGPQSGPVPDDGQDAQTAQGGAPPASAEPARPVSSVSAASSLPVTTGGTPAMAAVLLVPQAGPVSRLSMQASPFVQTNNTIEFTDGALTSVTSNRPGAIPAAAKVPLLALDAFASAFAKAVALRVEVRTTGLTQDAAAIDAIVQERLNAALMSCLDAAELDTAKIQACATAYEAAQTPAP